MTLFHSEIIIKINLEDELNQKKNFFQKVSVILSFRFFFFFS
jgi:hypothetical protein